MTHQAAWAEGTLACKASDAMCQISFIECHTVTFRGYTWPTKRGCPGLWSVVLLPRHSKLCQGCFSLFFIFPLSDHLELLGGWVGGTLLCFKEL